MKKTIYSITFLVCYTMGVVLNITDSKVCPVISNVALYE